MNEKRHFILKDNHILAWHGHDVEHDPYEGYTPIATVIINRSCESLVRHANLAEDIEGLMDVFLFEEMKR